jgi:hypothetical protein
VGDLLDPVTGKLRLLSEQCSTCVGRPGNLMDLCSGRLKYLVDKNVQSDGMGLVCHQTLGYGAGTGPGYALCRWFHDAFGDQCNGIRVMQRLGGFTEVPPPGKEASGE